MATRNLHDLPSPFPPMPAVARVLSRFDRRKLEGFITVAIGLLDVLDGDPDTEEVDGFGLHPDDEYSGDEADQAWPEGLDQTALFGHGTGHAVVMSRIEDAEDDDAAEEDNEDCDGFENEPMFDSANCDRLNALFGDGPGGGELLDSDRGDNGD